MYVAPLAVAAEGAETTGGTVVLVVGGWCAPTVVDVTDGCDVGGVCVRECEDVGALVCIPVTIRITMRTATAAIAAKGPP